MPPAQAQAHEPEREITGELPAGFSSPHSSAAVSSPVVSWPGLISHAVSAALSAAIAGKALAWAPACLQVAMLPSGGVSHDPWAWAPLVLDLAAVVAVAAPVSFRSFLDFARGLRLGGGK